VRQLALQAGVRKRLWDLGVKFGRFEERGGAEGEGKVAALGARPFGRLRKTIVLRLLELATNRIVAAELKRSAKAVKGRAYILRIRAETFKA